MSTKEQALTRIAEEWLKFLKVAQGFSHEEQLVQGAVGHWSVKEVLIHIAAGDLEVVKEMEKHRQTGQGNKTSYYATDVMARLNEDWVYEKRGLPLEEVWRSLDRSHRELLEFFTTVPSSEFGTGSFIGDWVIVFRDHYRGHREELERWKTSNLRQK